MTALLPVTPLFVFASLAVAIAPGPDILYVLARGISSGRRPAIVAAVGFASGLSVHTTCAVLGLSAVLVASSVAFTALKLAGAGYLVYLGIKAILSRGLVSVPEGGQEMSSRRIFGQAFLVNVLNPKVAIFFLAFLPQFVQTEIGSVPRQLFVLGVTFAACALTVFSLVGCFSALIGAHIRNRPRLMRGLDYVAGGIFLALGARLAFASNR